MLTDEGERHFTHCKRLLREPIAGDFLGSSGADIRQLCTAGVGIARVGRFYAEPAIAAGLLVPLLEEFNPGDIETVSAIFAGHAHLATRVRAFIDFLIANVGQATAATELSQGL